MKTIIKLLFLIFILNSYSFSDNIFKSKDGISDTLFIVGVRFNFQKELYQKTITSGDGTFEYGNISEYAIDPTPHDKKYFETHFESAKNYFEKASNKKLVIKYKIFPEVSQKSYQLPKEMMLYSPDTKDYQIKEDSLMTLVRDVLILTNSPELSDVNSFYKSMQEKESDHFKVVYSIIHAGAFAGTDGVGSKGADSPCDIFSTYISPKDFIDYNYMLSSKNSLNLNKMMIIPERLTQDKAEFQGTPRIEFAINGLLEYQIYKSLGMPDFFDTKNGEPEVGIFSPLDFSNYLNSVSMGGFLIEPSAYEKVSLGWSNVIKVNPYETSSVIAKIGDVIEIKLNKSEKIYFELKGRKNKTTTITMSNGNVFTINDKSMLNNDKDGYKIKGIVSSCENYNFILPDYGVLAWYVNEDKVKNGSIDNTVNVGENGVYGVKLLEADGKMNIGDVVYESTSSYLSTGSKDDIYKVNDSSYLELLSPDKPLEIVFKVDSITDSIYQLSFNKFMTTSLDSITIEKKINDIPQDTVTVNDKQLMISDDIISWAFILRDDEILVGKVLSNGNFVLENLLGVEVPKNSVITNVKKVLSLKDDNDNYYFVVFKDSTYEIYDANLDMVTFTEKFYKIIRDRVVFPREISSINSIYIGDNYLVDSTVNLIKYNLSVILPSVHFLGLNGKYDLETSNIEKKEISKFFVYPNPISKSKKNSATFMWNSKFTGKLGNIKIYSLIGEKVLEYDDIDVEKGWNSLKFNISSFYNDVYVAIITIDGISKKFKIAIRS